METKSYTLSRVVSDYECENRTLESNEICQIEAEEHDEKLFEEITATFGDGWTLEYDNNQSGKGVKMSIFGSPKDDKETFLSEALIARYNAIFDRAEKKVANDETLLVRVKSARLPVYYAMLEIAKDVKTGNRGAFDKNENGELVPKPEILRILYDFVYHCLRTNVSRTQEWNTTPKEYLEEYIAFLRGETLPER